MAAELAGDVIRLSGTVTLVDALSVFEWLLTRPRARIDGSGVEYAGPEVLQVIWRAGAPVCPPFPDPVVRGWFSGND